MSFFARFTKKLTEPPVVRAVPPGMLVYAIGDIHGRDDLFAALLDQIAQDRTDRAHEKCALILLGDLVDRGPDSASVVERALALAPGFDHFHFLIGNHEECMLAALTGDERALRYFVRIGGDATVRSYMCDDPAYDAATFEELAKIFPAVVPQRHIDFLGNGEDQVEYGDYLFVHAGVRPGVALDKQRLSDLRWIREEFLSHGADFGRMIVHGHTITEAVDEQSNRIGIDTGAYHSGRLTALGLSGDERWTLQTGG
jgi:serine/threonine protein phosphatase 1